ncbi:hypothetical protein CPC08DRAFT_208354 [Agrocybe pediades]|nr:hypothetical protein CPC08DRAFT_208354 [Agrocybe pediades]
MLGVALRMELCGVEEELSRAKGTLYALEREKLDMLQVEEEMKDRVTSMHRELKEPRTSLHLYAIECRPQESRCR